MKPKNHIIRNILIGLAFLISILFKIYHKAVYAVIQNLLSPKLKLISNKKWEGGISYLEIPYSNISKSDYLNLYVPRSNTLVPLLILVHGGGFITNDCESRQTRLMYQYFRDHGYACASINYRLAPKAAFPAAIEDVKAGIRYLRANADKYGYNADNISIWGESAGGYLAAMAALTKDNEFMGVSYIGEETQKQKVSAKVSTLIVYYGCIELGGKSYDWKSLNIPAPVISIANYWINGKVLKGYKSVESFWLRGNIENMTREELAPSDPYNYIKKNIDKNINLKVWISHGDCDITIPYPQSVRFYKKLADILGTDRVKYVQRHNFKHGDDRFYLENELEQLRKFLQ